MALRIAPDLILSASLLLSFPCISLAREAHLPQHADTAIQAGIVTDRLSPAQLRIWKSIIDIVMAQDQQGRLLHPFLHRLYQQAATSDHRIHIELSEEESLSHAGRFTLDEPDPARLRHVATIRLNLATIRRTYVGESSRYSNGLIPFAGLGTRMRYAEVLGHELAHFTGILLDQDYLQLYGDLARAVADYELRLRSPDATPEDLDGCLNRIRVLTEKIEKPAKAAEAEIWRELRKPGKQPGTMEGFRARKPARKQNR